MKKDIAILTNNTGLYESIKNEINTYIERFSIPHELEKAREFISARSCEKTLMLVDLSEEISGFPGGNPHCYVIGIAPSGLIKTRCRLKLNTILFVNDPDFIFELKKISGILEQQPVNEFPHLKPSLLLISEDEPYITALSEELLEYGFSCRIIKSPEKAADIIESGKESTVIIDFSFSNPELALLSSRLHSIRKNIQTILLIDMPSLKNVIEAYGNRPGQAVVCRNSRTEELVKQITLLSRNNSGPSAEENQIIAELNNLFSSINMVI